MTFFNSAVDVLQTLVIASGTGLAVWGTINLVEGYENDNPGAKGRGVKQLMTGGGVALIGLVLVSLLFGLFGQFRGFTFFRTFPLCAGRLRERRRF